jgi:hypothetical protein
VLNLSELVRTYVCRARKRVPPLRLRPFDRLSPRTATGTAAAGSPTRSSVTGRPRYSKIIADTCRLPPSTVTMGSIWNPMAGSSRSAAGRTRGESFTRAGGWIRPAWKRRWPGSESSMRRRSILACWPRASVTATILGSTFATCLPACQPCFPGPAKMIFCRSCLIF